MVRALIIMGAILLLAACLPSGTVHNARHPPPDQVYGAAAEENAFLFSYVNDAGSRKFLIFRKGEPWKTVAYQPGNDVELFGDIKGDKFYSYVNDSSGRRFILYRDGSPWKTVPYSPDNQSESFGMIMPDDQFQTYEFYSYVNDATARAFHIYKAGKRWKTIRYNATSDGEQFGQFGGASASNTVHAELYSYINDSSNRRFLIYRDGSLWKTIGYGAGNQAEAFGEITSAYKFVSYVNDVSNKQFLLFKEGTLWKTQAYNHANEVESLGRIVSY